MLLLKLHSIENTYVSLYEENVVANFAIEV